MSEPTTHEVYQALSAPAATDRLSLGRRRFLQAAGATTALAMLPTWLAEQAAAAAPLGATDGVLVVITMGGGNDGLNTVVPVNDSTYYGRRGSLAIPAGSTLPIDGQRGLHPTLRTLKAQWDQGNVAVIEGVGHPDPDLSHFTSTARIMHGSVTSGAPTSGWLGRYLDDLPGGDDPYHAIAIGHSVPLAVQGNRRRALSVPQHSSGLFSPDPDPVSQRQYAALHTIGASSTGLGPLGDALAVNGSQALLVANRLSSAYDGEFPDGKLARQLVLCARLINANLGIRVLHVQYGDFDTHAGQPGTHDDRMAEFEAGLAAFYATLSSTFAGRTLLLAVSEFGRRIASNNSDGTDHGAANTWLAIGAGVNGGRYGDLISLANPDNRGNVRTAVDYRNVYSTVIDTWLDGDGSDVVGRNYTDLGFLGTPSSSSTGSGSGGPADIGAQRAQLFRLYLAYYLRMPDYAGLAYWQREMAAGRTLASVSEAFARAPEFRQRYGALTDRQFVELVYQNVLGRTGDRAGIGFWEGRLRGGQSRGRVMIGFSESQEFVDSTRARIYESDGDSPVGRLYRAYFLRRPDAAGLQYWHATGLPLHQISDAFAKTPEFRDRYGVLNDDAFVKLVYQNVLDRQPDNDGLQYWKLQLRSGLSRGELMVNFSESDEFIAKQD